MLQSENGAQVSSFVGAIQGNVRVISGDVLTGDKIAEGGFLGYYS